MYIIHLAKEPFKFSCSHFTILAADRAERLHGHNYQVQVRIKVNGTDPKLGLAFDFNDVKPLIRQLCETLDERILLPQTSPYLKIQTSVGPRGQVQVDFGPKHYSFPATDTLLLPLVNITSEELARYLCETLVAQMRHLEWWTELEVSVEETRGQSVSYVLAR